MIADSAGSDRRFAGLPVCWFAGGWRRGWRRCLRDDRRNCPLPQDLAGMIIAPAAVLLARLAVKSRRLSPQPIKSLLRNPRIPHSHFDASMPQPFLNGS
jgi:hypothetical protein